MLLHCSAWPMLLVPVCGSASHCVCRSASHCVCRSANHCVCGSANHCECAHLPQALVMTPDGADLSLLFLFCMPLCTVLAFSSASSANILCLPCWSVCSLCMSVWLPTCLHASLSILRTLSRIQCCFTCRCADKGKLVEVRNHDWWGAPALGTLGPPAAGLQGSIGHQPVQQQSRSASCCWCKAEGHSVKDCPLNAYLDEQMEDSPKQDTHLAQHAGKKSWSGLHLLGKEMTR